MQEQSQSVRRFSFDTAAVWALSLTAFISTVLFIPNEAVSFYATKVTLLAVGILVTLIAFVIARLVRGSLVVPPLALLGTAWLLPIAYGLSALFSGADLKRSFFGSEFEADTLGFIVLLALLTTLAALALRRVQDYKTYFNAVAVAIGVALVAQAGIIIAARSGAALAPTLNMVGAFTDFGMIAGLAILLALMQMRFLTLSGKKKIALWVAIVLSLLALMLVNSALVWIFVALVSLGLFIEAILRRRGQVDDSDLDGVSTFSSEEEAPMDGGERRGLAAPLITLLISLFFLIGGSSIGNAVAASLGINTIDVRPSWQSTFAVGSHTYASSPLFGSGPGTFGEQWLLARDRALNETVFWNVDFGSGIGSIPTSFVTTGIVGVVAWLVLIGMFLYAGVRTLLFRLPQDSYMRFAALASWSTAAYVLVLAFFATPGPVIFALGFLALGVFISTTRHGKGRSEWGIVFAKSPRVGFAIVFMLTLLLLASVAGTYVVLERYLGTLAYGEASVALARGDIDRAESALSRSLTFAPTERGYRLAAAIGIERMRSIAGNPDLAASVAQEQFQGALSASVAAGTEAARLGANDYQNWAVLGGVYQSVATLGIEGAYEGAKSAFERALALNPSSPVIPYVLAQLEIGKGNGQAAEARLLESVNQKRDYIPAILLLSQLEVQLGKATEALQAAEAAAYFAPNEPSVLFQVGLLRSGTGDVNGAVVALARAVELNPNYANARFFLGAMHANQGRYPEALEQFRAVAALSAENAGAVAADIAALEKGENPFPTSRLRSLGIPTPPVTEPTPTPEAP